MYGKQKIQFVTSPVRRVEKIWYKFGYTDDDIHMYEW